MIRLQRAATALATAGFRVGVLLLILVPLLHESTRSFRDLAYTGIALGALILLSTKSLGRRDSGRVLVACLVAFLLLQLFFATNQASEPYSDFRTHWETAVRYASEGLTLPDTPQTQRSVPFYYPLVLLFGSAPAVYVTANIVMTTLTWLMTVWIARRFFGWSAAAKTGILLLFAFEPYLANNIPSHDILGACGLLLFLLLLTEFEHAVQSGDRSLAKTAAFACAAALVIAWTQWQRGTGVYCMAALLLYGAFALVARVPIRRPRVLFACFSLLFAFTLLGQLGKAGLVVRPLTSGVSENEINLVAFSGYDGPGRYRDKEEARRALRVLETDSVRRLGKVMLLETLRTGAVSKYANYLAATSVLLQFGKEKNWYTRTSDPGRYVSVASIRSAYESLRNVVTPALRGLLILAAFVVLKSPGRIFDYRLIPFSIVAVHLFVMGALSENQTRYSYFVFYLAAVFVGAPWRAVLGAGSCELRAKEWAGKGIASSIPAWLAAYATVILLAVVAHRAATAVHDVYLVNFHSALISRGPEATLASDDARAGFGVSLRQNSLKVRTPAAPDDGRPLVFAHEVVAKSAAASALRFSIENGPPLDAFGELLNPEAGAFRGAPGRSFQLLLDGRERRVIDLSVKFDPSPVVIEGIEPGPHRLELVFRFGKPRPDSGEVETTVSYLGIY